MACEGVRQWRRRVPATHPWPLLSARDASKSSRFVRLLGGNKDEFHPVFPDTVGIAECVVDVDFEVVASQMSSYTGSACAARWVSGIERGRHIRAIERSPLCSPVAGSRACSNSVHCEV